MAKQTEIRNLAVNLVHLETPEAIVKGFLNVVNPPEDWPVTSPSKVVVSKSPLTEEQLDEVIDQMAKANAKWLARQF